MKKYNFNAGPCVLPRPAVESAIEAIRNFDNTGIGVLEYFTPYPWMGTNNERNL